MNNYLDELALEITLPHTVPVNENEVIFLHGNITSVSISDEDPYTIGINTKSNDFFECEGIQAVKFLNVFPEVFFHGCENLLKLRNFYQE